MSRVIDMSGRVVKHWTVLRYADGKWLCRCRCGHEAWVAGSKLRSGKSGCCERCRRKTHGASKDSALQSTYQSWKHMRRRCLVIRDADYKHYGGRGITICKRWNDFACFLKDMGLKPAGLSLERIDTNGNYMPSNCRWATQKEQTRNQRRNRRITFKGRSQSLVDWCDELKLNYYRVHRRLRMGWSIVNAFDTRTFTSRFDRAKRQV